MNLNDKYKQPNIKLIKLEADDTQLTLLEDDVCTIKSETASSVDIFESPNRETLEQQPFKLKSETLAQDWFVESDANISIKQELLHEEINIKSEHEPIQELDDKYNVGNHMKLPSGTKSSKCNICGYISRVNSRLKRHLRTHSGEKPFKCDTCDYSCSLNQHLQSHLRTHTREKPYKCSICDNSYRYDSSLRSHLRTHTGVKLLKCNFCDYSCIEKSNLRKHLKTHIRVKSFKCGICNIIFRHQISLNRHMLTHNKEAAF